MISETPYLELLVSGCCILVVVTSMAIIVLSLAINELVLDVGPCMSHLTLGLLVIDDLVLGPSLCPGCPYMCLGVIDNLVLGSGAVLLAISNSVVSVWSHQVTLFVPRAARVASDARAGRCGFRCATFIISIVLASLILDSDDFS